MSGFIEVEDVEVTHNFLKKHITFILSDPLIYKRFYNTFERYFFSNVLSKEPYKALYKFLDGNIISEKEKQYLINNLRRLFSNQEHFKGIVGEHLFAYYYENMVTDVLWMHGPKGRSSAEPGIDFVTFNGDITNEDSIKMTIWETKTTENTITTRASQVCDFFSNDGSFEENIDSEITIIQKAFEKEKESYLKETVNDLYKIVLNREKNLCIGASGISPISRTSNDTFKGFGNCFEHELEKEQRIVKFIFLELLMNLLEDLRDNIWNKLLI